MTYKQIQIITVCFVAGAVSLLTASGQVRQTPNILFNPGGYRLGVGDEVQIEVFGEPEVTVRAKINRTGSVRRGPTPKPLNTQGWYGPCYMLTHGPKTCDSTR